DGAGCAGVEIVTLRAFDNHIGGNAHRLRERAHQALAVLKQVQRRAPRRARAIAGQAGEKFYQMLYFSADHFIDLRCQLTLRRKPESLMANTRFRLLSGIALSYPKPVAEDIVLIRALM